MEPPRRAATVTSRKMRVKCFPRLASWAAFLRLMVLHLLWPDIVDLLRRSPALPRQALSRQDQATASRPQEEAESPAISAPPDPPRGQRDEVASPAVAEQTAGARLEDGKTYLRRVVAKDGGEVILGGIAYSAARPNAVINGSIVTPGDMISGFTVVAITAEHVELEADGVRILLTLH